MSPTFSFILSHTSSFNFFFFRLLFWLALFFLDPNIQFKKKIINDWLYVDVEKQKANNYVDELNWTKDEKGYENIKFC